MDPGSDWRYFVSGRPAVGCQFAYEGDGVSVRVESSEEVELTLLAASRVVWFPIRAVSEAEGWTHLEVSGLVPGRSYRRLQDGRFQDLFVADAEGWAAFPQDLSGPHVVELEEVVAPAGLAPPQTEPEDGVTVHKLYGGDTFDLEGDGWGDLVDHVIEVYGDNVQILGGGFSMSRGITALPGIRIFPGCNNVLIDNIVLKDFTRCVSSAQAANITLSGVSLSGAQYGLADAWSSGVTLANCTITGNGRGVHLTLTYDTLIGETRASVSAPCTFSNNAAGFEYFGGSVDALFKMRDTTFNNNGSPFRASAESAEAYKTIDIDTSNFSDGLPVYYITGASETVYDSVNNITNYFFLGGCSGVTVSNAKITATGKGVMIGADLSDNLLIDSCTVDGSFAGIVLDRSTNCTVTGCEIQNFSWHGILATVGGSAMGHTISGNTVSTSSSGFGISLARFSPGASDEGVTVTGNSVTGVGAWGLYVEGSSGNWIGGNTLTSTGGFMLAGSSADNSVSGNTIASSHWTGLRIASGYFGTYPSNNWIIGNILSNPAVLQAWDDGAGGSTWDDGEGSGNYWSTWTTPDVQYPLGVVDAPFPVQHNPSIFDPKDNFPRTGQQLGPAGAYGEAVLCDATRPQEQQQVIPDGNGGVIIVWRDARNLTVDIYAQRLDASGAAQWGANGLAVCTAAGAQSGPVLVSDGAGGAIIAWQDTRNGESDIYAQRVNPSGAAQWTAGGETVVTGAGFQVNPRMVSDGAGGAVVVWEDDRSGSDYDIYAQRIDMDGKLKWTDTGQEVIVASKDQNAPELVLSGSGGAIVLWHDTSNYSDIYAQRLDPDGAKLWGNTGITIIADMSYSHVGGKIVTDGANGAIIAWSDNRGGTYDIFAQWVDSSGGVLKDGGVEVCAAAGNQTNPDLVPDREGGAFIAWQDNRVATVDIYAIRLDGSGGSAWTDGELAVATGIGGQQNLSLKWDGWGGVVVAWEDDRNGLTGFDIYAQRITGSGSVLWTANGRQVTTNSAHQRYPKVACDGRGRAVFVWQDQRAGNIDLYVKSADAWGVK